MKNLPAKAKSILCRTTFALSLAAAWPAAAQSTASGTEQPAPSTVTAPAVSTPPRPAMTPEVQAEAARQYELGQKAFQTGQYEIAQAAFSRSYTLSKEPDLLYNMAKVALRLNQRQVALGYYREYISHHPKDEVKIQKEIERLTEVIESERGDGAYNTASPAAPAVPATTPNVEPDPLNIPRWVPWALIGGGIVLVGTSLGLLVAGGVTPAETSADQAQRRSMLAVGGVLGGIGLGAGIGGILLRVRERNLHKAAAVAPAAQVLLLPMGTGLQLVGSF